MALEQTDRVILSRNLEQPVNISQVKPRSRDALKVFDEIEEKKLILDDILEDYDDSS